MVLGVFCDFCASLICFITSKREMLKYCAKNGYTDNIICQYCDKTNIYDEYRKGRFFTT